MMNKWLIMNGLSYIDYSEGKRVMLGQCILVVFFRTIITNFLKLILIWVWNINKTYVYNMKLKFPGPLLSEIVICFLPSFFSAYKDHNKKFNLKKFEQLSTCSFGEICCQHLTRPPCIDLQISKYVSKQK